MSIPAGDAAAIQWPAVTAVIPTRDRPELLRIAIDAALGQDYTGDVQVVVVYDQAEPDHSLTVDDPHRGVTVIANSRTQGLAGGRNTGITHATTPLVAFCDDDDNWLPGKLTAQVEALRAHPDAALATTGVRVHYGEEVVERTLEQPMIGTRDLIRSRLTELHPSTFLFRRELLVGPVGLVDEEIPGSYAEDYELLLRTARVHPVVHVHDCLVNIIWHQKSYFTGRWAVIASALPWLLDRYPEFATDGRGYARVAGQVAFANAASGRRRDALTWTGRTLRRNPREPRAYLALAVAAKLVTPDRVVAALNSRGRGI